MFESISFLFLSALAFTAWSVLCYLDLIQQHKRLTDYQVELYTEHPGLTHVPQYCPKEMSKGKSIPYRAYDFLINLGFIAGGCFTLYKLLRWLELQTIWETHQEESRAAITKVSLPALEHKEEEPKKEPKEAENKEDHEKEHKEGYHKKVERKEESKEVSAELKDQLNLLQGHYLEMHELLRELHASNGSASQHETNSNRSTSSDAEADIITWKSPISSNSVISTSSSSSSDISATLSATRRVQLAEEVLATTTTPPPPPPPTTQNVFITNSHIHINGRVYISQKNVNIDLCRQASMYTRKQSEFLQVWDKFISGPKERPMIAGVRCNNILM